MKTTAFLFVLIQLCSFASLVTADNVLPKISCKNVKCMAGTRCKETSLGPICKPIGPKRCFLKADPGPCDGYFPKYYYDYQSNTCEKFTYGGCNGNKNRFSSEKNCEKICIGKRACQLPKFPGPCKGAFLRYWYNSDSGKCEQFIYGGCLGNSNRFSTLEQCQRICQKKRKVCPPLPPGTVGICVDLCSSDADCDHHHNKHDYSHDDDSHDDDSHDDDSHDDDDKEEYKCCSNGCGHACMKAVVLS